jgi:hypothetical protein
LTGAPRLAGRALLVLVLLLLLLLLPLVVVVFLPDSHCR